jgi:peptidoglycan/LPS O-acetylase OafA/YrhL
MQTHATRDSTWLPGLDGLRAIAVVLVIAFHLDTKQWVPGGFVGVDLFFVLSGFLITRLLLDEHERKGRIELIAFYLRRLRRLLPALVLTLTLVGFVSIGVLNEHSRNQPSLEIWTRSALWSLGYGYNWLVAFDIPYMHSLVHVWSLSIEEQFYVVWPALLLISLHLGLERRQIRRMLIVLIGTSLALPLLYWDWIPFWHWGGDWRRMYYGSDYRAHALLAGCLLATLSSDANWLARLPSRVLDRSAVVAACTIGCVAATATLDATWLYLGGFALVVLACATIVLWATTTTAESAAMRVLESVPMVWIGKRSYGLYLYHMPLVIWSRELQLALADQVVLVSLTTLLITEASYRWVERPIVEIGHAHTRESVPPSSPHASHASLA